MKRILTVVVLFMVTSILSSCTVYKTSSSSITKLFNDSTIKVVYNTEFDINSDTLSEKIYLLMDSRIVYNDPDNRCLYNRVIITDSNRRKVLFDSKVEEIEIVGVKYEDSNKYENYINISDLDKDGLSELYLQGFYSPMSYDKTIIIGLNEEKQLIVMLNEELSSPRCKDIDSDNNLELYGYIMDTDENLYFYNSIMMVYKKIDSKYVPSYDCMKALMQDDLSDYASKSDLKDFDMIQIISDCAALNLVDEGKKYIIKFYHELITGWVWLNGTKEENIEVINQQFMYQIERDNLLWDLIKGNK